mmetsp:Transcript_23272/g.55024  ORF Transcript_23272/g.55024 Transcript_23272/m.55024 type:complete len:87 (-) Transcript_23272:161-421(-)
MCPLRFLALLMVSLGLASYMGPLALGLSSGTKRPGADEEGSGKRPWRRVLLWLTCFSLFALHTDLLLSLGYTRCAFQYASTLHKLR